MMDFFEDEQPESNRTFWLIMLACIIIVTVFLCEIFVRFYLQVS